MLDASQMKSCAFGGLVGSSVKVTLEIEGHVSGGVPEDVVRTITENTRTLNSYGFEQE